MSCPEHSNDWSCAGCAKLRVKKLEKENAALRGLINGIISQTSSKMQNYMVQAAYDGINTRCKDGLEKIEGGEG